MINRMNKPNFVLDMVIFVIIIAASLFLYHQFNPSSRETRERQSTQNAVAEERYQLLSTRFSVPQTVLAVENMNTLVFDGNVRINLMYDDAVTYTNMNNREVFEAFAKENLVGKQVTVSMPTKDYFIRSYCCWNQKGDDSYGTPSNYEVDQFFADVYFNGEMLNQKFGYYK